ncbi:hypothetical protein, partial [Bacteroides acidifaciens]|uniref:hypothetical protein n=1 Tax=Bacteroides acidifaciens TaxID=85831 RepID=UPI001C5A0635
AKAKKQGAHYFIGNLRIISVYQFEESVSKQPYPKYQSPSLQIRAFSYGLAHSCTGMNEILFSIILLSDKTQIAQ